VSGFQKPEPHQCSVEITPNVADKETQASNAVERASPEKHTARTTDPACDSSSLYVTSLQWDETKTKSLNASGIKNICQTKSKARARSHPPRQTRPPSLVTSHFAHRFAPEVEVSRGKRKTYSKHPLVAAVEVKQPSQAAFAQIGLPLSIVGPPRLPSQEGRIVKEPHMHDVLLGRGPQLQFHPGNLRYRRLVWENKEIYSGLNK
jgi:hypothetical protein